MKSYTILDASLPSFKNMVSYKEVKTSYGSKKHFVINGSHKSYKAGDYFTISFNDKSLMAKEETLVMEVVKVLKTMFKKYHRNGKILLIGLGNPHILADTLGPATTSKIMATYQYDFLTIPKVAIYNPNVTANTGISSFHLIKMVVKDLEPDLIIVIDSLQTKNLPNLNNTIEINDETFNIPLITIGSPLVYEFNNQVFTSVNCEEVVSHISNIIALSLKSILF